MHVSFERTRRRPTGVDGEGSSQSRRVAAAAGVLRPSAARGTSRLDIAYTHYERRDLTLTQDLLRPPLPRRVDERLDVALRRRLEHAVAEVEHVHARPAGPLDACFDRFFYFLRRTE